MRTARLIASTVGLLLVSAINVSVASEEPIFAALPAWVFDGDAPLPEVPEPSGLCYCPPRDSLFIVDDGAEDHPCAVYELDLHAKVLAKLEVGSDLEGVCYCPADELLYVCDEEGETVHVVDPDGLKLVGSFTVSREWQGAEVMAAGGNGFEGIEYIPAAAGHAGDYFLLLNQDDPTGLARVDRAAIKLAEAAPVPLAGWQVLEQMNAGELYFDVTTRQLWVIHSWMNVMELLDVDSGAVLAWEVVPGCAQEAVAVDGQGRLWIGADSGGITRYLPSESKPSTAS
jgi:hypothetical protein